MFEKEAKEYLKKDGTKAEQILNVLNEISPLKITLKQLPFILAMFYQTFQEGAEFGYKKANEWHYVKDGNPKNENDILCRISKDEVVVGYYHSAKKRYITIDGQDIYNIIAWKEIILPELKESE